MIFQWRELKFTRLGEVHPRMLLKKEGWVGVDDLAAYLRKAKESIFPWSYSKGFPAHQVGCLVQFKLSEVDQWVQACGGNNSGVHRLLKKRDQQSLARRRIRT